MTDKKASSTKPPINGCKPPLIAKKGKKEIRAWPLKPGLDGQKIENKRDRGR